MTRAGGDDPTRTVVQFTGGVHVPAWLAVLVGLALLFSALGFLLSLFLINGYREDIRGLEREIRVLQLHTQDVESVLIQQGLANRDDFAEWGEAPQRTRPPARESEE